MEQRSVLRRTNGLGGTRPAHLSGQRKALRLTTVVWNGFSLDVRKKYGSKSCTM